MRISVIGTGYVGLVSGACFADMGHDVVCLDVDPKKIDLLNNGGVPIYEPGLDAVIERARSAQRIQFTTDYDQAVQHGEIIFIAVGTPPAEDGSADLKYVMSAARSIGERIQQPTVVVNKSTVPVGTADQVHATITEALNTRGADVKFAVVSNPEFLKEGAAIGDFMKGDRIVIGSNEDWATEQLRMAYAPINRNHEKIIVMDVRSAELTKYAANAMLATRISFMNELANLAEVVGADIEHVRHGIGSDSRIGTHFLYAGCGYGGSCFPKDVQALVRTAHHYGKDMQILRAVESVNQAQKSVLFAKLADFYGGPQQLRGKTIAVWGLAFKPNTDDMREAPSRAFMSQVLSHGGRIRAYDPVAMDECEHSFGKPEGLTYVSTAKEALEGANALAILTEWIEFRSPDFSALAKKLSDKLVVDGRNLYEPEWLTSRGMSYRAIGRNNSKA
jgi:UDPglucose 6-dehydrogenase